jgi:hypothetical protein
MSDAGGLSIDVRVAPPADADWADADWADARRASAGS